MPFPARAGMNRRAAPSLPSDSAVPRTRGDEPARLYFKDPTSFRSPHARG